MADFVIRPLWPLTPKYGYPLEFPPFADAPYPRKILRRLTRYLRECPCVVPWIGPTVDEIGGKFTCMDGTAIHTDGVYYWRFDLADYLEHYPYQVDQEALDYFVSRNWDLPDFWYFDPKFRAIESAFFSYRGKSYVEEGAIIVQYEIDG